MQMNIHDFKKQKKDISTEFLISQKLLFFVVSVVKFNLSPAAFRKGDCGKCQDNLIYRNLWLGVLSGKWNPDKHKTAADIVGVAKRIIARLWNRFQEAGQGHPRVINASNGRYILLTAR
ncbi:hypothetical protein TNCV_2169491 [Trichonephila clavipes]|nr:hypothetical protein TNCV_2169491 [Trichonephila clavipes]